MRVLVAAGCGQGREDANGSRPLTWTAQQGHALATRLVQPGAEDVEAAAKGGGHGQMEVVTALLQQLLDAEKNPQARKRRKAIVVNGRWRR